MLMQSLETSPVNSKQIRQWTQRDPILLKVSNLVLQGWATTEVDSDDLVPYARRKLEISVEDGCLLWGQRVIVPTPGRQRVINELHEGHPGTSRMKSLAGSYVWWPGIDSNIEDKVKSCPDCQQQQKSPPSAPLQLWEWPERPWSHVHADYDNPFLSRMVLVDAHSKWMGLLQRPLHRSPLRR